ncbi:MAG TPA: diacylglycerol kinase [Candidatus Uhrbacteria bacterium]|nr:diacylglycerol kinase [Candidatus Uhrbacteria bacterium]
MINFQRLGKSFKYAFSGLQKVFKEEQNFRIHIIFALAILILALFFQIRLWQVIILILVISLIFILEIINSIFERLLDLLKPRMHQYVRDIKDMGAALVLVGAVAAVLVGILIFLPYIIDLFF